MGDRAAHRVLSRSRYASAITLQILQVKNRHGVAGDLSLITLITMVELFSHCLLWFYFFSMFCTDCHPVLYGTRYPTRPASTRIGCSALARIVAR